MKEKYCEAEIELIPFEDEDIITTSDADPSKTTPETGKYELPFITIG